MARSPTNQTIGVDSEKRLRSTEKVSFPALHHVLRASSRVLFGVHSLASFLLDRDDEVVRVIAKHFLCLPSLSYVNVVHARRIIIGLLRVCVGQFPCIHSAAVNFLFSLEVTVTYPHSL